MLSFELPRKRPLALVVASGVLLLSACSSGTTAAPQASDPVASSVTEGDAAQEPQGSPNLTVGDIVSRYPDCDAVGALLGSSLDGMEINPTSPGVADDSVACGWIPETIAGSTATTIGVAIDANAGADDVPDEGTLELIGAERIADTDIESQGGIAYMAVGSGDLRITVTSVVTPGVTLSITHGVLGADPTLVGPTAVTAMKQLLGLES